MQRPTGLSPTINELLDRAAAEIFDAIRAHLVTESAAVLAATRAGRGAAAAGARTARTTSRSTVEPKAPAPATPPPAAAPAPTPKPSSSSDLIDRVRADLRDAYEGRPVTPDRIAFRLKADRDLVDAALTYLVTRRQARMMGSRGKVAYVPVYVPGK